MVRVNKYIILSYLMSAKILKLSLHIQAAIFAEIPRDVLLVFGIAMKLFAYGNDKNKLILMPNGALA